MLASNRMSEIQAARRLLRKPNCVGVKAKLKRDSRGTVNLQRKPKPAKKSTAGFQVVVTARTEETTDLGAKHPIRYRDILSNLS